MRAAARGLVLVAAVLWPGAEAEAGMMFGTEDFFAPIQPVDVDGRQYTLCYRYQTKAFVIPLWLFHEEYVLVEGASAHGVKEYFSLGDPIDAQAVADLGLADAQPAVPFSGNKFFAYLLGYFVLWIPGLLIVWSWIEGKVKGRKQPEGEPPGAGLPGAGLPAEEQPGAAPPPPGREPPP